MFAIAIVIGLAVAVVLLSVVVVRALRRRIVAPPPDLRRAGDDAGTHSPAADARAASGQNSWMLPTW